ncbi:Pyridoxamine 5'-phosphate oxidase [Halohasta litchfieldiae]|uniref:Pyridoxamine 5'-phosphate oxidase n=1 Tax=Halohasta litchfieldiae TaxID=1073996 RepID=A0A1H6WGR7_9EURY|nr:pyridoxamine 5'-phosphate oxidase family protein [Halohasta litchfieldiae]SEJ11525.1 Pyridoxamine 5'-phosphate oxidase [Halohasta litchfieldiae]
MSDPDATAMDDAERDSFLEDGGTGVMSLSTTGDERPHSMPVSYGYDPTESTFYFRLAVDAAIVTVRYNYSLQVGLVDGGRHRWWS